MEAGRHLMWWTGKPVVHWLNLCEEQQENGRQSRNTAYVVPVDRDSFVPGEATSSITSESAADVSNPPRLSHTVDTHSDDRYHSQAHERTYLSASGCVPFLSPCQSHVVSSVQRWQLAQLAHLNHTIDDS